LSDFIEIEFSLYISKNTEIWNFMKIRPVGTELYHSDRRTDVHADVTKLIVVFRNFVKAPKNVEIYSPTSIGGQEKDMKYITVPWPPLEAALSNFNVTFVKTQFFKKELMKTKEISINAES
jgi:hypothetical protein